MQYRIWAVDADGKRGRFLKRAFMSMGGQIFKPLSSGAVIELTDRKRFIVSHGSEFKDKTGRTIFEGDIVRLQYGEDDRFPSTYLVEFKQGMFGMNWPRGFTDLHYAVGYATHGDRYGVILGNKYENPELMSKLSSSKPIDCDPD